MSETGIVKWAGHTVDSSSNLLHLAGFQLIFSPLSYPGSVFGLLQINMYTMPAIVANVLVGVSLVIMAFFFDETPMFREGKRDSVVSTGTVLLESSSQSKNY